MTPVAIHFSSGHFCSHQAHLPPVPTQLIGEFVRPPPVICIHCADFCTIHTLNSIPTQSVVNSDENFQVMQLYAVEDSLEVSEKALSRFHFRHKEDTKKTCWGKVKEVVPRLEISPKESSAHCKAYGRVCVAAKCTTATVFSFIYDNCEPQTQRRRLWSKTGFYELVPSRSICWGNRFHIVVFRDEAWLHVTGYVDRSE
jgi:hypothetical protein